MRSIYRAGVFVVFIGTMVLAQTNPVPLINNPLVPASAAPGRHHGFKLTVNGTGFVSGSLVRWNSTALATTFVSGSRLTATVPDSNVATAGTASVTVVNPAPGGGPSNVDVFDIRDRFPAATFGLSSVLSITPYAEYNTIGDFNRDGKLDLAFAVQAEEGGSPGWAALCLGNGDGTFQPLVETALDLYGVYGPLAADFNGDGKLDLLIEGGNTGTGASEASILLGNGDGTFQPPLDVLISTTSAAELPVVGDFNGDGKTDLAVGTYDYYQSTAQVAILLGNGNGTFQPPTFYTVGSNAATGLVAGDFNGDGRLDLAVGVGNQENQNDDLIAVLLGNGDGTFQTLTTYPTSDEPYYMVGADFNGDGRVDLAFTGGSGLSISLGNGDGTFQPFSTYPSFVDFYPLFAGDFNGDGKIDLATTLVQPSGVALFLGRGDGTFQPAFYPTTKAYVAELAAGDFNGDGEIDMVGLGYDYVRYDTSDFSLYFLPQISAVLSTGYIDFGVVPWGSQSTVIVNLTNAGTAPLVIEGTSVYDRFKVFHETDNCGHSVAAGTTCAIKLVFRPLKPGNTSHGRLNGLFRIRYRDATEVQQISLTGMSEEPSAMVAPSVHASPW